MDTGLHKGVEHSSKRSPSAWGLHWAELGGLELFQQIRIDSGPDNGFSCALHAAQTGRRVEEVGRMGGGVGMPEWDAHCTCCS